MKVAYFQPPAPLRIGGLDAAIKGLNHALRDAGLDLIENPTPDAAFDLAHFHGLWQPAHARIARELAARRQPYIVSPHGMLEPWAWRHKWWKKWPYFHLVEKRFLANASALLATGAAEARRLASFTPAQRIEQLPLGLTGAAQPAYETARRALGWAPDELVLLYLSRLHVKKGADLLLRALAGMHCPAVTRLVIVGEGDRRYVDSLRAFAIREAAKLPRIDWISGVWGDARWKFFQGADWFILPTHSENFGLAVLEALQVGTPALTTEDTPWAGELSPPRGMITRPTIPDLRTALERCIRQPRISPDQRREIAEWTRSRYDWSLLAPRYAAFFKSVCASQTVERGRS